MASRGVALGGVLLLGQGCNGENVIGPRTGVIEVTVTTSGLEPDPDGYTLSLDDLRGVPIGTNAERTLTVNEGRHTLSLDGLAGDCAVAGERRRAVTVEAGATVEVEFRVSCVGDAGGVRIITATAGDVPDPDGYEVVLDEGDPQPIGTLDTLELTGLDPGDHEVRLLDVAENCSVTDGATRTVSVTAGTLAELEFQVTCVGRVEQWTPMESGSEADLADVWGTSATDVFTVGELGTEDENGFQLASVILHHDGTAWSLQRRIRDLSLRGVWGSSATDVWAVGFDFLDDDARVLHYDGAEWTNVPGFEAAADESIGLFAVWGSSGSDVYAVGSTFNGEVSLTLIFHYDGATWQRMAIPGEVLPSLTDVWGSSATDVYVVGENQRLDPVSGTILHFDGGTWTPVLQEPGLTLTSVWGSAASDVFAAGFTVTEVDEQFIVAGAIRHFDGHAWSPMIIPDIGILNDLWGTSASDVFAVGEDGVILHYDGVEWTATTPADRTLLGVWSSSSSNAFAVGNGGLILHGTP